MHFFNKLSACTLLAKQTLKTEDEVWEKPKPKKRPPASFPYPGARVNKFSAPFSV